MAFDQKIFNIAQLLSQHLTTRLASAAYPSPVVQKYDANKDLYLEVNISGGATPDAIVRLRTWVAPGNEAVNPVTGLAQTMFNPHYVEVGFDAGAQATATATLNAVVATNTLTVNGVVFTGVAAGAVGDQFNIGIDDTATAANIAAAINASVTAGVTGVVTATSALGVVTLTAVAAGTGGNSITLAGTAVRFVVTAFTGGTGTGTPATDPLKVYVLCDAALAGPEMFVYEKAAIVVTDLGNVAYFKAKYSSLEWGQMDRQ